MNMQAAQWSKDPDCTLIGPVLTRTGGPSAPDLNESLQNFGINLAAVLVLGFIIVRDLQVDLTWCQCSRCGGLVSHSS